MELKVPYAKSSSRSPSNYVSDPTEKEVSDEDDDDRNHKHRRRDTRSQSLERDSSGPDYTRPYRKRDKHFENGFPFRENEFRAGQSWRNYSNTPLQKDFTMKFEKMQPGFVSMSRGTLDLNQRIRANQIFSGGASLGRGRGSWNQYDSGYNTVDIATQMGQHGPITPGLFAGRRLSNVTNPQGPSWNAMGLMTGLPNGGPNSFHSIGLPSTLRPPLNSSFSAGIPRQRCRDFEERGFCLRGDMCPMEHGVNRIVVEDVQSLSQFNLPVSLSRAPTSGNAAGTGTLSLIGTPSNSFIDSKGRGKGTKLEMADNGLALNVAYSGSAGTGGTDSYDPDQPLWNRNIPETSTSILALHSPKNDDTGLLLNAGSTTHLHTRLPDNADSELPTTVVGSQSTSSSAWGRICNSKGRVKENCNLSVSSSDYSENDESKKDQAELATYKDTSPRENRHIAENFGPKLVDSFPGIQRATIHNTRKHSQKAMRTLFVNGIPLKSNKVDALFSHFQNFGQVIDVYIPANSERAFVQFSMREEAEAALRAPDAVMGNRFIKLWWANRDNIPEDVTAEGSNLSVTLPCGVKAAPLPPHSFATSRAKDSFHPAALKRNTVSASDTCAPASDQPKSVVTNDTRGSSQKKQESLEQLKEEMRKKQELLDQKRNEFRRQLDRLAKQATGGKGDAVNEQASKRQKVEVASDVAKVTTLTSFGPSTAATSPHPKMLDKDKHKRESFVTPSLIKGTATDQEFIGSKHQIRPLPFSGTPLTSRYKLDNRPTVFRVVPPLPPGLENVDVLKQHFSSYGDLSVVELENVEALDDSETPKKCSARISFKTRQSAESAFVHSKCWKEHTMEFVWLTSSSDHPAGKETSLLASKVPIDDSSAESAETVPHTISQEAATSAAGKGKGEGLGRREDDMPVEDLHETNADTNAGEVKKC